MTGPGRRVAGLRPIADVTVVAVRVRAAAARDGRVLAPPLGVAAVGRAHDEVVTVERIAADAVAGGRIAALDAVADVAVVTALEDVVAGVSRHLTVVGRAGVAVVAVGVRVAAAGDRVERALAGRMVAAVDGAEVAVVARDRYPGLALPRRELTGLHAVAGVAVVALGVQAAAALDRRVAARVGRDIARVPGAHHVVVAAGRRPAQAAAGARVAPLGAVAEDTVVADHGLPDAAAAAAGIIGGALVVVVAGSRVGAVDALARAGVTAVVGADVAVVAVRRRPAGAGAGLAGVGGRAGVGVAS